MKDFWKRYRYNRGAVIGLVILAVVIVTAIAAPILFPTSPWKMVSRPFLPPFTQDSLPLGTDALGRNVLSGLAHGAYVSLLVGLVSTIVALAIGVPVGALAGYFVGRTDDALMRVTEFFQTIPSFALAIVLLAIFQPSLTFVIVAIAIVSWPPVARLVRGEVLSLRTREFVEAATLSGLRNTQIILHHILPVKDHGSAHGFHSLWEQSHYRIGGHRFARPAFAHDAKDFTGGEVEIDVLCGVFAVSALGQGDGKVANAQEAHSAFLVRRGFRASFSPSPIRFSASTVSKIAMPGKKDSHHAVRITVRAAPII